MNNYAELRAEVVARFAGHDYDPRGPIVFAWHVHHDRLLEPLVEPIDNRLDWIFRIKRACEIETRLQWLRLVVGPLPKAVVAAGEEYAAAWEECGAAWEKLVAAGKKCVTWEKYDAAEEKYDAAGEKYDAVVAAHRDEIEALHAVECPGCPWDGKRLVLPAEAEPE